MLYVDYDLSVTKEQDEMREAAHRFAAEVLRPAGIELDRMRPEDVVAEGSPLFDVVRQAASLGYTRLRGPAALGGLEADPLTSHLVYEELAWGSFGLAAVLFLTSTHADTALAAMSESAIADFAAPFYGSGDGSIIGCWAITEPDHGSDWLGAQRPELNVKARAGVVARRDGDDYIISGQKSAWVSNGPIATHAMLNVQLDPDGTFADSGVCILPLDLPGVSRGKPLDKHGTRSLPQGELFFDDVRIPKRWMVVEREAYRMYMDAHLAAFNAGVSCVTTGLARAAYDATLAYTKERVQGGRPIFEHQSVRDRLFRMFSLVQASRALSRGAWVYNLTRLMSGEPPALEHSIAAKVFSTRAAVEVTGLAMQLHGGNGISKEYPIEMFARDAATLTIADGENAMLSQVAAALL